MRLAVGIDRWDFGFGFRRSAMIVTAVLVITGPGGVAHAGPPPAAVTASSSFGVEFTDCSELASITTITAAKARTVVPASFTLAGDASGTPFVVRVAHCRAVSVDDSAPEAATVAQLGVSIVSPDGTGDINNYTAWYFTTSLRLAVKLQLLGVPAQWTPGLGYSLVPGSANSGTLRIDAGRRASRVPRHRTRRRTGCRCRAVPGELVDPVGYPAHQDEHPHPRASLRHRRSDPDHSPRRPARSTSRSVHRHVRLARLVQPIRAGEHDGDPLIVP